MCIHTPQKLDKSTCARVRARVCEDGNTLKPDTPCYRACGFPDARVYYRPATRYVRVNFHTVHTKSPVFFSQPIQSTNITSSPRALARDNGTRPVLSAVPVQVSSGVD